MVIKPQSPADEGIAADEFIKLDGNWTDSLNGNSMQSMGARTAATSSLPMVNGCRKWQIQFHK